MVKKKTCQGVVNGRKNLATVWESNEKDARCSRYQAPRGGGNKEGENQKLLWRAGRPLEGSAIHSHCQNPKAKF